MGLCTIIVLAEYEQCTKYHIYSLLLLESQVYYCMLPAVEQQQGIEFTIITLVLQHDAGRV